MCQLGKVSTKPPTDPLEVPYYVHQGEGHRPPLTNTLNMRKIEQQMNAAITNNVNWQSANTSVTFDPETNESIVRLHGNTIAVIGEDFVQIFDGGWQSNTTKSRLNAILKEHAINGECVYQKNFKWFVDKFIGQAGTSPVYNTYEFTDGFMFA